MTFNSTSKFYEYNRSIPDSGTFKWNVTCNGAVSGYDVLIVNDTIPILADTSGPNIVFVDPTDSNNTYMSRNWTYINVTAADAYTDISSCIDNCVT
jgi:hypothetical protein